MALTLDEDGIPETAEGRVRIAEKIIKRAAEYGISKKDIVFDTLAMTVSADADAAKTTLDALRIIKNELCCHTSLGVSNVSFGLPSRNAINSAFFCAALSSGLSAAIMNPYSVDMMKTYFSYKALFGMDQNCADYIEFMSGIKESEATFQKDNGDSDKNGKSALSDAIIKGLKEQAGELTKELLKTSEPLMLVQNEVIPALDVVGKGFENKTVYLPQLLMSAEAAKYAFSKIKDFVSANKTEMAAKCKFVIATVHGDIHDIGKNIVKLLLENYGFSVTDLGKDVPPEDVVETVIKINAPVLGLSALMTTTVPAMEETIRLIHEKAPWCKVVVGGAVLTQEYADSIGADKYAKDAMEAVRYAEEINESL